MTINYDLISKAQQFYTEGGYINIETPWMVSKDVAKITRPPNILNKDYFVNSNKCLVASGEQSFLYLYSKGQLLDGKWQTTTPCFRDEVSYYHRKFFIKTELIEINPKNPTVSLDRILLHAKSCIGLHTGISPEIRKTDDGLDLEIGGVEIGSYGIRKYSNLTWVYGTGIAEPRLSIACEEYRRCK